jgi:hypothetical protein
LGDGACLDPDEGEDCMNLVARRAGVHEWCTSASDANPCLAYDSEEALAEVRKFNCRDVEELVCGPRIYADEGNSFELCCYGYRGESGACP